MPIVKRGTGEFVKFRPLISGQSNYGKTKSLITFLYGKYDYFDETQRSDAVTYSNGKTMVIISCPGETGFRSLPPDTEQLTSYYREDEPGTDFKSAEYSSYVIDEYNNLVKEVERNRPDILWLDGIHGFYDHLFNEITDGIWLSGEDLDTDKDGKVNKYKGSNFHRKAQRTFLNYLGMYFNSPIPLLGLTTTEVWKGAENDNDRAKGIDAKRYLWPNLAGAMATLMPGKMDARLSARRNKVCLHTNCQYTKEYEEHYVWQFLPKDDVMGLAIKGLNPTEPMEKRPWIHQTWPDLKNLLKRV